MPERLREIREERRPGSPMQSLESCRYEVRKPSTAGTRTHTDGRHDDEVDRGDPTTILHNAKLDRHIY